MKKAICILLSVFIVFSLSSCGKSTVNSSETNAVKKVIRSVDDYLDYKITKEELKTVVDEVRERLKSNEMAADKQSSKTTEELISDVDSSTIRIMLINLSMQLSMVGLSANDDDIKKIRNELAEKIGESQRN